MLGKILKRTIYTLLSIYVFSIIASNLQMKYLDIADSKIISPSCKMSDKISSGPYSVLPNKAGCVIIQDNKVLVVQSPFNFEYYSRIGKYTLPGGTASISESSACTAARETFEETGIDVIITDYIGTSPNGFNLFICEPAKGILTERDLHYKKFLEIADVKFIDINDKKDNNKFMYKADLELISQYIDSI